MADDLSNQIRENAAGPAEASVDGQTVKQHALKDQVEVDRYLASKAASKRKLGVRLTRVVPPGGC